MQGKNCYSKDLFQTALRFQENLDWAKKRGPEGVQANINLGYFYLTCINENNTTEKNEEALTEGVKYYVAALNLAKELNLNDAVKDQIVKLLKDRKRDEQGNRIEESPVSVPSSPKFF